MKSRLLVLATGLLVGSLVMGEAVTSDAVAERTVSLPTSGPPPPPGCSGGGITILDNGPADPYPSTCNVSGLIGSIVDVNMHINGLSHTFPDDIDMLLVARNGDNAIVMSDAGGEFDVVNCDLTLDDQSASPVSPETQIACPGNYQPADYQPGDPFPAPAPTPSGNVNLSTLMYGTPNGTWSLYVVDDTGVDVGF